MSEETWTVGRLLQWTAGFFEKKSLETPRLDAEVLLAHVLKMKRLDLYTGYERPMAPPELDAYRALVKRRAEHEPIAYLVGEQGFHDIELKVDKRVLVPRPETELLVEVAAKHAPERFADIGTGSGAIVLALLHTLPAASALATDKSEDAITVAQDNARRLSLNARVQFRVGEFFAPFGQEKFDLIVSNPPYVGTHDAIDKSVADFEPKDALFAGDDGLDALRVIVEGAQRHLRDKGALILECGQGQAEKVAELARAAGFVETKIHNDHAGIARIVETRTA